MRTVPVVALTATIALGALAGCSDSESTQRGLADVLADEADVIAENLAEQGLEVSADAVAEGDVTCPEELDSGAGATTTCTVTVAGQQVDVVLEFAEDSTFEVTSLTPVP